MIGQFYDSNSLGEENALKGKAFFRSIACKETNVTSIPNRNYNARNNKGGVVSVSYKMRVRPS